MRALAATVLLCAALPAAPAEVAAWNFRVLLDGREIGRHQFTLRGAGEQLEVVSEARFDVRVLFVNAYRYQHEARERWHGDCLQSLEARTSTNGKRLAIRAIARGDRLAVERPAGRDEHAGCVMSFAYWNPRILRAQRLLNSQTGELLPVQVTPRGAETIEVRGRPVEAERHRLSGPALEIDLWYADGQWLALEALAAGDRRLRYVLM